MDCSYTIDDEKVARARQENKPNSMADITASQDFVNYVRTQYD